MGEPEGLSKDEKLVLATKIVNHVELSKATATDGYDVLMIVAHLLFPGQTVNLEIKP